METVKDIGKSLSTSQGGAGLGSGMVLIPQVMNAPMQSPMQAPMQAPIVTVRPQRAAAFRVAIALPPVAESSLPETVMGPRRLRGLARGSDLFVHERLLGFASFYDWCARNDDIPELVTMARTISALRS